MLFIFGMAIGFCGLSFLAGKFIFMVFADQYDSNKIMNAESVTFEGVVSMLIAPGRLTVKDESGQSHYFNFQTKIWQRGIRSAKLGDTIRLKYWDEMSKDRPILLESKIIARGHVTTQNSDKN